MGRDTESGSQVFEEDNQDLKSISHNFSSLSGSVSNICWVNIKVRGASAQKFTTHRVKHTELQLAESQLTESQLTESQLTE